MKFTGMKIITKIKLSFILIVIFAITALGYFRRESLQNKDQAQDLFSTFIVSNSFLESEVGFSVSEKKIQEIAISLERKDREDAIRLITDIIALDSSFKSNYSEINKQLKDDVEKNISSQIKEQFDKWEQKELELIEYIKDSDLSSSKILIEEAKNNLQEIMKSLHLMNMRIKVDANNSNNIIQESLNFGIRASAIISIILLVLVILIALLITRDISHSLSLFKHIFKKGASGDLEARYPSSNKTKNEINELGIFFNNFMDKVKAVIKDIIDVSNDLGASSEELSVAVSNFAENSQSQAAAVEEVTATMEEINVGVENVSGNTQHQHTKLSEFISLMRDLSNAIILMAAKIRDTQGLSMDISGKAKAGNESLSSMDILMKKITVSSDKVSNIVSIIVDISDKINLLSLNAAIEAARAGEAGRGFAVVADEISKLADQTASSIGDIDSLIKNNKEEIVHGTKKVFETIDNIGGVIKGVESIIGMMNAVFSDMEKEVSANESVNKSAEELKARSEEVKNATEEQRIAVAEVMKSITNINDLVQSSAAGAEEMTASANKLTSMAEQLMSETRFFNLSAAQ
jgi:methyl-accepting chemotaxis protein